MAACALHAQRQFEAASIRPHPEPVTVSGESISGSRATWTADTLFDLIVDAYDLRYGAQISGAPRWATSDRFDVVATANSTASNAPLSKDQVREMLRALLADRFQLKVHRETKEIPVYALVAMKSGSKLQPADLSHTGMRTMGNASGIHITAWQASMNRLAEQLSVTAGRPVLDKTGLGGSYAFTLNFNPNVTAADSEIASMTTALEEQLGLKLEAHKALIEVVVIDSVSQPTSN